MHQAEGRPKGFSLGSVAELTPIALHWQVCPMPRRTTRPGSALASCAEASMLDSLH